MMFVILLNGPPRSGKDTIAEALCDALFEVDTLRDYDTYKFAWAIKNPVKAMFRLNDDEYKHYFETAAKDEPQEIFHGKTPRSVLISLSEQWAKPMFGKEIYGEIAGRYLSKTFGDDGYENELIIVSDCGFEEELQGLFKFVPPEKCGIFRIQREGASYKSDSRGYVENTQVAFNNVLDNNRDVSYAVQDIMTTLKEKGII